MPNLAGHLQFFMQERWKTPVPTSKYSITSERQDFSKNIGCANNTSDCFLILQQPPPIHAGHQHIVTYFINNVTQLQGYLP